MRRLVVLIESLVCAFALAWPAGAQQNSAEERGRELSPPAPSSETEASQQARRLFDEGIALAERKEWETAGRAFEQSYRLARSPDALFAWAQAERLAGRCDRAMPLYQKFLTLAPRLEHAQAAEIGLRRCAEARVSPATATPGEGPAQPVAALARSETGPSDARTDWVAGGLLALGTVGLGVGTVSLALSIAHERSAGQMGINYDQYLAHMDRARLERVLGAGTSILGAALVTAAMVRLLVTPRAPGRLSLAVEPSAAGAKLVVGRRF
jgi:tetratricopeptide (TPR) repeat protein